MITAIENPGRGRLEAAVRDRIDDYIREIPEAYPRLDLIDLIDYLGDLQGHGQYRLALLSLRSDLAQWFEVHHELIGPILEDLWREVEVQRYS